MPTYAPGDPNTPSNLRTAANGWNGSRYLGRPYTPRPSRKQDGPSRVPGPIFTEPGIAGPSHLPGPVFTEPAPSRVPGPVMTEPGLGPSRVPGPVFVEPGSSSRFPGPVLTEPGNLPFRGQGAPLSRGWDVGNPPSPDYDAWQVPQVPDPRLLDLEQLMMLGMGRR